MRKEISSSAADQDAAWQHYVREIQAGRKTAFSDQWAFYNNLFASREKSDGPPVAWTPGETELTGSNLARFMKAAGFETYTELQRWSAENRAEFWQKAIDTLGIKFSKKYTAVQGNPGNVKAPEWLQGATFNIVDSCFRTGDEKNAIVYAGETDCRIRTVTYGELRQMVNRVANGIRENGFPPKCGIALYMPMNVECVAAYLGIIKAGCHVISVADSYSPKELKRRIEIAGGAGVITVQRYTRAGQNIELYKKVIESGAPRTVVISDGDDQNRDLRQGDLSWESFLSQKTNFNSIISDPREPVNILFSSGTTGDPKAIGWNSISPVKAISDGYFHHDIRDTDIVAWPTNIGWMMGPWLIFATLANKATIALFNGVPNGQAFIDFVYNSGITIFGTIPSLVRAWRTTMESQTGFWPGVRLFSSTGEPSNVEDYLWLMATTDHRAPVIEYCGGTEISGGYITGSVMQPASPALFSTPALGLDFRILGEDGREAAMGETGEVFIVPPSVGLSESLLNKDHDEVYYQGCPPGKTGERLRRHGDYMTRLPDGFYRAQGRSDDSMNIGGIKVSSLEIEEVVNAHARVFESAAISVLPEGEGGEKLIVYIVSEENADTGKLRKEFNALLAERLNPLFKIYRLLTIDKLPRTASNKIMRRLLRDRYISPKS